MCKSAVNCKLLVSREIDRKTDENFSGEQFIRINYHSGGVTKVEILSRSELIKKMS